MLILISIFIFCWNGYSAVFTFTTDDGKKDNLEWAKVFEKFGYKFTIFIPGIRGELTVEELNFLHEKGIEIGNHSFTHQLLIDNRVMEVKYIGKGDSAWVEVERDTFFLYSNLGENYKIPLNESYPYIIDIANYINTLPTYRCSIISPWYKLKTYFTRSDFLTLKSSSPKYLLYKIIHHSFSPITFFQEVCNFGKWLSFGEESWWKIFVCFPSIKTKLYLYLAIEYREVELNSLFSLVERLLRISSPSLFHIVSQNNFPKNIKHFPTEILTSSTSSFEEIYYEISWSKKFLEEVIYDPSYVCETFAYPNDLVDSLSLGIVKEHHIGARAGGWSFTGGSRVDNFNHINIYSIPITVSTSELCGRNSFDEKTTRRKIKSLIKEWVKNKFWAIVCVHGLSDIDTLHLYWILDEIHKDGRIWVAKFNEVVKYIRKTYSSKDSLTWFRTETSFNH